MTTELTPVARHLSRATYRPHDWQTDSVEFPPDYAAPDEDVHFAAEMAEPGDLFASAIEALRSTEPNTRERAAAGAALLSSIFGGVSKLADQVERERARRRLEGW